MSSAINAFIAKEFGKTTVRLIAKKCIITKLSLQNGACYQTEIVSVVDLLMLPKAAKIAFVPMNAGR